jgi:glucosamine--fructose-6-phosphate aminotransferase (isomerizing)
MKQVVKGESALQTVMLKEIGEQPDVVKLTLESLPLQVAGVAKVIAERGIRTVCIAARGTSDHVAIYAKYLLEIRNGMMVALAAPSVITLYGSHPYFDAKTMVIGISQSGAGPDVVAVCEEARRMGATTMAITNTANSQLAECVEFPIVTPAGAELSVAATKTYTTGMAVVALLSDILSGDFDLHRPELSAVPAAMRQVLSLGPSIQRIAEKLTAITTCVVLGRGYNQCTAQEIALKLMETCQIGARAFSAADFLHGPVSLARHRLACLMIAPSGLAYESVMSLARRLREQDALVIGMTDNAEFAAVCDEGVMLPQVPEWLSPITCVVAGQLLANALASEKGLNPDSPLGLSKVTMTI